MSAFNEYFPLSSRVLGGSYTATCVRTLSTSLFSDARLVGSKSESSECVLDSTARAWTSSRLTRISKGLLDSQHRSLARPTSVRDALLAHSKSQGLSVFGSRYRSDVELGFSSDNVEGSPCGSVEIKSASGWSVSIDRRRSVDCRRDPPVRLRVGDGSPSSCSGPCQ